MTGPGALWVPIGKDLASGRPLRAGGGRRGPFLRHLLNPTPVLTGTLSERLYLTTANIHTGLASLEPRILYIITSQQRYRCYCSVPTGLALVPENTHLSGLFKGPAARDESQFCDMHDASFTAHPLGCGVPGRYSQLAWSVGRWGG